MDWRCRRRTCIPLCNPVAVFSACKKAILWIPKWHMRDRRPITAQRRIQWLETKLAESTCLAEGWPSTHRARGLLVESGLVATPRAPTTILRGEFARTLGWITFPE